MKEYEDFYFDCILGFFILCPDLMNVFLKELKNV